MLIELLLAGSVSLAADRPPTAQELRAAYCLRVLRYYDDVFAKLRGDYPQPEAQHQHDRNDAEQRALRRRYEAQLLPYFSEINLEAVSYTIKAADDDYALAAIEHETPDAPETAALKRLRSCRSLDDFAY